MTGMAATDMKQESNKCCWQAAVSASMSLIIALVHVATLLCRATIIANKLPVEDHSCADSWDFSFGLTVRSL